MGMEWNREGEDSVSLFRLFDYIFSFKNTHIQHNAHTHTLEKDGRHNKAAFHFSKNDEEKKPTPSA